MLRYDSWNLRISDVYSYRKKAIPYRYRKALLEALPVTGPLPVTGALPVTRALPVTGGGWLANWPASQLAGYLEIERQNFHDFHDLSQKSSQML